MIQTGEIIIIALLALVVLGPTRLPDMARKMGRWTMELRNAARDITRGLESEVQDFKQAGQEFKEAGQELKIPMDEVKNEVKKPFSEIRDEMSGFGRGGHEWKGPKPVSGPTPEDAMRDLEEMNREAEEENGEGDATLPGSAGTPPDRPAASPSPSPGANTSPNASPEEETGPSALEGDTGDGSPDASQGEETGDTDETRE